MVITKREMLVSIAIVAVMLFLGILISDRIEDSNMQYVKELETATRIDANYAFDYGMRTNVGNTLAYGELTAIDPVSFPELTESFLYVSRTKERYTQHTRVVNNGKTEKTETYWRWDNAGQDVLISDYVLFLGKEIATSCLRLPSSHSLCLSSEVIVDGVDIRGNYIYESNRVRYSYDYVPVQFQCTMHCNLSNESIGDTAEIFQHQTIQEVINAQSKLSEMSTIAFWIGWVVVICLFVFGFYVMENHWIE